MNIKLFNGSSAFLIRDGHYLVMKRSPYRTMAPGVWSSVGGRVEQSELNDPKATCLREVEEETGITPEHIYNLRLRYLMIRRSEDTIRQNYVYFGETDIDSVIDTEEGELAWIPERELLDRTYTKTFELMLKHYLLHTNEERVIVGVAENDNGQCRMIWSALEDFEA